MEFLWPNVAILSWAAANFFLLPTTIEHTLNFRCRSPPLAWVGWAGCESSDRFWNDSVFNSAQLFFFFLLWRIEIKRFIMWKDIKQNCLVMPNAVFRARVFKFVRFRGKRLYPNYRNGSDFPHTCTTRPVALKTSSRQGALWGGSGLYIFFLLLLLAGSLHCGQVLGHVFTAISLLLLLRPPPPSPHKLGKPSNSHQVHWCVPFIFTSPCHTQGSQRCLLVCAGSHQSLCFLIS